MKNQLLENVTYPNLMSDGKRSLGMPLECNDRSITVQGTENLQVGDLVWTVNETGERFQATTLKTVRVIVSASHQMVHVVLSDGLS